MIACPECGAEVRVTRGGLLYRHGDCPGGGRPPDPREAHGDSPGVPAIVYLVRPGDRNEELRYSLRSLRHVPHERVVLVGHGPPWVQGVEHVATRQERGAKGRNIRLGYEAIATSDLVPEHFLLMNDDFHAMRSGASVMPAHRGLLADLLRRARPTGYFKALTRVAELLPDDALAYDAIHRPLPMTKHALAEALERYDGHHGIRTLAGNILDLGGVKRRNAKNPPEEDWPDFDWLSTSDRSFRYSDIGAYIRKRHRRPCKYEAAA